MNEETLKQYILDSQNIPDMSEVSIESVGDGKSQNHLNYKVTTPEETFLLRVVKEGEVPLSYANLSDEYTILKLVEEYDVAPRALKIDLEGYNTPVLFEEFLSGSTFTNLKRLDENTFDKVISLIVQISQIEISAEQFPFKYSYSTYKTNFKAWETRIEEIARGVDDPHVLKRLEHLVQKGRSELEPKEKNLRETKREFIFNDVHPGNVFLLESGEVKFIDWQKVSIGDPSFMLALFIKRFGEKWGMDMEAFKKKSLQAYSSKRNLPRHFKEMLDARIFERAISDAIWSVWAQTKRGESKIELDTNPHVQFAEEF